MKYWSWLRYFLMALIAAAGIGLIGGCDSGEKVLDEVTGNRAVKQYHQSKKRIERLEQKQAERYKGIPEDDEKKDDDR